MIFRVPYIVIHPTTFDKWYAISTWYRTTIGQAKNTWQHKKTHAMLSNHWDPSLHKRTKLWGVNPAFLTFSPRRLKLQNPCRLADDCQHFLLQLFFFRVWVVRRGTIRCNTVQHGATGRHCKTTFYIQRVENTRWSLTHSKPGVPSMRGRFPSKITAEI